MLTKMQEHIHEVNGMFAEERKKVQKRYKEYEGCYLGHYVQKVNMTVTMDSHKSNVCLQVNNMGYRIFLRSQPLYQTINYLNYYDAKADTKGDE